MNDAGAIEELRVEMLRQAVVDLTHRDGRVRKRARRYIEDREPQVLCFIARYGPEAAEPEWQAESLAAWANTVRCRRVLG